MYLPSIPVYFHYRYVSAEGEGEVNRIIKAGEIQSGLETFRIIVWHISSKSDVPKGNGFVGTLDCPCSIGKFQIFFCRFQFVGKGVNGERSIAATDFFTGLFTTALQEDEIIIEIKIPIPPANSGTSYQKFMQPASRFAIVGCAAVVTKSNGNCERVRVAFSGLGDNAFRATAVEDALTGTSGDEGSIGNAAAKAGEGVDPLSDYFASAEYRLHLAQVYARKALTEAVNRV